MNDKFNAAIEAVFTQLIEWRRHIHRHPEVAFNEFETSKYIIEQLQTIGGFEISQLTPTSVIADLIGANPGKTIAFRADIDALPIQEVTDIDFVSENDGVMHACGHDTHTAMLLAAAKVLAQYQTVMHGNIRFIFQHAEELPPGGAAELVAAGVLDGVDYIFGQHVFPQIPAGMVAFKPETYVASSDIFDIVIKGKGGHAAMPQEAIDPIVVASDVVSAFQKIASRRTNPLYPPILSVTKFIAGDTYNVIPDEVQLAGTYRTFDETVRAQVPVMMEQILKGITESYGATYTFDLVEGYPTGWNTPELTALARRAALQFLPETAIIDLKDSATGSEDFASYQTVVPGNFSMIGIGNKDIDAIYNVHHPKFKVDESGLKTGLSLFLYIADALVLEPKDV